MVETEKKIIVTLNQTRKEIGEKNLKTLMADLMDELECTFDLPEGDSKKLSLFVLHSLADEAIRGIIEKCIGTLVLSVDIPAEQEPALG